MRRLLDRLNAPRDSVRGLSFGSQLDGVVMCDADGKPLRPAIIWMDRRATAQADALAARISPEDFYAASGANLDCSHGVFKALWVRDMEPSIFRATRYVLPPGSWVLRQATGETAVDVSNASSLGLLDPHRLTWSEPLLAVARLDATLLPSLVPATSVVGPIDPEFAYACGLDPTTCVGAGCGDEMAATLGAGVLAAGEICDITGTAEPVCAVASEPLDDPTRLVECHPHALPELWLLENPGFVSGGNLRWWRDQFFPPGTEYESLTVEAATVPPGSEGVVFLPCMQGAMAPEWNEHARGSFHGLSLAHSRSHLTRAILEGSAFALRDIIAGIRGAGLPVGRITAVGGGARSSLWRQIKADVTGLPIRAPRNVETTATGAAILAVLAAGIDDDASTAIERFVDYEPTEQQPDPEHASTYDSSYGAYRAYYNALYR